MMAVSRPFQSIWDCSLQVHFWKNFRQFCPLDWESCWRSSNCPLCLRNRHRGSGEEIATYLAHLIPWRPSGPTPPRPMLRPSAQACAEQARLGVWRCWLSESRDCRCVKISDPSSTVSTSQIPYPRAIVFQDLFLPPDRIQEIHLKLRCHLYFYPFSERHKREVSKEPGISHFRLFSLLTPELGWSFAN